MSIVIINLLNEIKYPKKYFPLHLHKSTIDRLLCYNTYEPISLVLVVIRTGSKADSQKTNSLPNDNKE